MKNLVKLSTLGLLATMVIGSVDAAPAKATPPKCSVCHMQLTTKKTKTNTVAVRLKKGGPIYYCCAMCKSKMPASILVKPKGK